MTFIGQNKAGGTVQMGTLDGKPGVGPMQLLLVAIAGANRRHRSQLKRNTPN